MTWPDLEHILRPPAAAGDGPWRTAAALILTQGVDAKSWAYAIAWPTRRCIGTPPVLDDGDLALVGHEVAHVLDEQHEVLHPLTLEFRAWVGAIRLFGPRWSPAMHARLMTCLPTYGHLLYERDTLSRARWCAVNTLSTYRASRHGIVTLLTLSQAMVVRQEREALMAENHDGRIVDQLADLTMAAVEVR